MIRVKFKITEKTKKLKLNIQGHAGQSTYGNDIVCASASILAYTLAQNLIYLQQEGFIKGTPIIKMDDGNAKIECFCKNSKGYEVVGRAFCTIQTGFQLLAHNYPQFVELEKFE